MKCNKCGKENRDDANFCEACGSPIEKSDLNDEKTVKVIPMNWYKFLVGILLPFSAFFKLIDGLQLIISPDIDEVALSMLGVSSVKSFEQLNIFYGICVLITGVFTLYTWFTLKKFRKTSLLCISTVYIMNFIISAVYLGLMAYLIGLQSLFVVFLFIFIYLIETVVIVLANRVYFKKREFFFVN